MIAALASGALVLNDETYANAARRAAGIALARSHLQHQPGRAAYLDDYTLVVWGLLNLYEATFDARYLNRAISLERESLARFRDDGGRFYLTANDAERLLVRPRETIDGSLPSGNSVQLMNLVRLSRITGDPFYDKAANDVLRSSSDEVSLIPSASALFMSAVDFFIGPSFEIVLAGNATSARSAEPCSRRSSRTKSFCNPAPISPASHRSQECRRQSAGRRRPTFAQTICANFRRATLGKCSRSSPRLSSTTITLRNYGATHRSGCRNRFAIRLLPTVSICISTL